MVINKKLIPPDGGWGWMVVAGVSSINLFTRAIEPSFGLLFGDILRDLGVETTGAAVIMSTLEVLLNFSGIFVGPLIKKFSYRKIAMVGSILVAIGLIATGWANSMAYILITYSIINGLGVGLSTSAGFVGLNNYFQKRRGQAVGFSAAGVAFGMMLMPQGVGYLLNQFGFRGTIIILGGLSLNAFVASLLLQPAKWHYVEQKCIEDGDLKQETIKEEDEDEQGESVEEKNLISNISLVRKTSLPPPPKNFSTTSFGEVQAKKRKISTVNSYSRLDFTGSSIQLHIDNEEYLDTPDQSGFGRGSRRHSVPSQHETLTKHQQIQSKQKKSFWRKIAEVMDFDLLKDPIYLNLNFGLAMFYVAEQNFKVVLPFFFYSLGYEKQDIATFLTIQSFADMIARIILPTFCDKISVRKRTLFMIGIIFLGISRSVLVQQVDHVWIVVSLFIAGFLRGASFINFSISISEYASLEKLPAAYGLHNVAKGTFVVVFGPMLGKIRDLTQSYPTCVHAQTFLIMTSVLSWSIERYFRYCRGKKFKSEKTEMENVNIQR